MATLKNICNYFVKSYENSAQEDVAIKPVPVTEQDESRKLLCSGFVIFG